MQGIPGLDSAKENLWVLNRSKKIVTKVEEQLLIAEQALGANFEEILAPEQIAVGSYHGWTLPEGSYNISVTLQNKIDPLTGSFRLSGRPVFVIVGDDGLTIIVGSPVDSDGDGYPDDWEKEHDYDPDNPNSIIALANGYCFYHNGLITVKKLLNVRQDVNFHTGNILFVGNIIVHGNIFPGFSIRGSNILVKGRTDGGVIKASGNIICESAVKGSPTALLHAGGTIRLPYCEQARIITPANLIIDGACIHSELYVGGSLVVKGRLQGGVVNANGLVYIRDQIGNVQGAVTRISLGYNPTDFLHLQELTRMREEQTQNLQYHTRHARKGPHAAAESAPFLELAARKLAVIDTLRHEAWRKFSEDDRKVFRSRVIAPGIVYPGVEISIGKAFRKVVSEQRNIFYCLHEDEITHGFPALTPGKRTASS
jgi:hypothetical protein